MTHASAQPRSHRPLLAAATTILAAAALALGTPGPAMAEGGQSAEKQEKIRHLQSMAPYRGYLEAHKDTQQPRRLLGGPLKVEVEQDEGGVFVALPSKRRLDPDVFGHPGMPRAFAGTPGINGVPFGARGKEGGQYTRMKKPTPFGDKFTPMAGGRLSLVATDRTATDAGVTRDQVRFEASWQDADGNTYTVQCCAKVAAHGVEFPTFGGVVTNHILHGSSRLGTSLMPTEFAYVAFWGMGELRKNGEVVDKPRLIHGMLTEYVRTGDYKIGFDRQVDPTQVHFHLMVPPMEPRPQEGVFHHKAVNTGLELPNGKTLPFWHVMFESLRIEADRG